jgi:hypothetical protein
VQFHHLSDSRLCRNGTSFVTLEFPKTIHAL